MWEHFRTNDPCVFYYTPDQRSDYRTPLGALAVSDLALLNSMAAAAIRYSRDIVVCSYEYVNLPNSDFMHWVRLRAPPTKRRATTSDAEERRPTAE